MVTIAEQIVLLRGEREQLHAEVVRLQTRAKLLSAEILGLEQSITPRKVPAARNPNDVVMVTEPALSGIKGSNG